VKKTFWKQKSQEVKDLIHLRDHVEVCLLEFKKLEVEVSMSENILNPILEQAKKPNKKLNEVSNESLWVLKIRDRIELMEEIDYSMWGKCVC